MSVAFTKEESAETAAELMLPDRPVSQHPNLVTTHGLDLLKQQLADAQAAYDAAQTIDDVNERRRESALPLRDVRYLSARLRTAQVVEQPDKADVVAFGTTVTFERDDGRKQTYRLVGEDEADPAKGTISYVSPVARMLNGKAVGDTAKVANQELEILEISNKA